MIFNSSLHYILNRCNFALRIQLERIRVDSKLLQKWCGWGRDCDPRGSGQSVEPLGNPGRDNQGWWCPQCPLWQCLFRLLCHCHSFTCEKEVLGEEKCFPRFERSRVRLAFKGEGQESGCPRASKLIFLLVKNYLWVNSKMKKCLAKKEAAECTLKIKFSINKINFIDLLWFWLGPPLMGWVKAKGCGHSKANIRSANTKERSSVSFLF